MKSVGERLRRERVDHGIDLATISSLTRISQRYLQAIEAGNIGELPSGFFYRSFVRQYACALGLDTHEIEAELEQVRQAEIRVLTVALQQAEFPIKPQLPVISESSRGTSPIWASVVLLVAVLAVCSTFYVWWHGLESGSSARQEIPQIASAAPDRAPGKPGAPAIVQTADQGGLAHPAPQTAPANPRTPSSPEGNTLAKVAAALPASAAPVFPGAAIPPPPPEPKPESDGPKTEFASPTQTVAASGSTYLQVAAVAKSQAELFVDVLAKKGFHALYTRAPVPNTYRVLVGPFQDATAVVQARMNLNKVGFKGSEGFVRNRYRIRRLSHRRARSV